jgi:hypothetical protein
VTNPPGFGSASPDDTGCTVPNRGRFRWSAAKTWRPLFPPAKSRQVAAKPSNHACHRIVTITANVSPTSLTMADRIDV